VIIEEPIPGVLVFKNALDTESFDFLNFNRYVDSWKPWLPYGQMSKIDIKKIKESNFETSFWNAISFYKNKYNLSNVFEKQIPGLDLLHYKKTLNEDIYLGAEKLSMRYHVDNAPWLQDTAGYKNTLTLTFYLNDEYTGGDIYFVDLSSADNGSYEDLDGNSHECIFIDKPKKYSLSKGDITVFPSSAPYYHAVSPIESGDRYLFRSFAVEYSPGSKEWNGRVKEIGLNNVLIEDQIKAQNGFDNRDHLIEIFSRPEDIDVNNKSINYIIKKEESL
jgi:hypothetical protein